jgi:uncharacterized integral membrane protein
MIAMLGIAIGGVVTAVFLGVATLISRLRQARRPVRTP